MQASSWIPSIALRHLAEAERHELPVNPAAASDYRLIRATLAEDAEELIRYAADRTDSWDQAQRLAALLEAWKILGTGNGAGSAKAPGVAAAVEAWRMFPGVFPAEGVRVPMRVEMTASDERGTSGGASVSDATAAPSGSSRRVLRSRRARRILHRLGVEHVPESPLLLVLSETDTGVTWWVSHSGTGETIMGGTAPLEQRSSEGYRRTLETIAVVLIGGD
jgi:hypothetical protein